MTKKWICRESNPEPLACEANVIPLHYKPSVSVDRIDEFIRGRQDLLRARHCCLWAE